MEKLPKVLVIMSTYNGEKYLREQIDSVLAQRDVDVTLYISDDCSKDSTQEIIKDYAKKHKNIIVHINEKNKNFTYNFLDSLFEFKNSDEYDFYAFSDQDDFWVDDKLITAVNKIKEIGKCTLYSSNLKLVDENLEYFGKNMNDIINYTQKKKEIFLKNMVTGCTAVFDKEFKNLATKYYPEDIYLHDYWLAIIAHCVEGTHFIYDVCPDHILYRQHGNNMIGAKKGSKIKGYLNTLFKKTEKKKTRQYIMSKFYLLYKNETAEDLKELFESIVNLKKLKNKFYLISNVRKTVGFFVAVMLNKY